MWEAIWLQLASQLGPKIHPNRSKRAPNSKPTYIMFSMPFLIDFGSLLSGFLVDFGSQVEGQVDKKSIIWPLVGKLAEIATKPSKKKPEVFQCFLIPRPSNFEAKLTKKRPQSDQRSSKNLVSILILFFYDFGTNLCRFGKLLTARLEPCWNQMASKPDPKTNQKNDCFLEGFRNEF